MVASLPTSPRRDIMANTVYANYISPSVMTDANSKGFPICDERITENDQYVIKIIGIHCEHSSSQRKVPIGVYTPIVVQYPDRGIS